MSNGCQMVSKSPKKLKYYNLLFRNISPIYSHKGVQSYYTDDNKIQKMIRIGENTLAVTDEMGTVNIYFFQPNIHLIVDSII